MSAEGKVFDLDTFFSGQDVELANLAAQLMTERSESDDSMWSGCTYGGAVESILLRPGSEELLRRELLRILDVVGVAGEVIVTSEDEARIRIADIDLSVTSAGVTTT